MSPRMCVVERVGEGYDNPDDVADVFDSERDPTLAGDLIDIDDSMQDPWQR